MANALVSQPLGSKGGFNWVFLVELLVCGILAVFFLFYFNRLVATVTSYLIRAVTWHYFRAYIDITSLQLSPLGGRLFLKRIRYQAHNETILVQDAQITWRYWIRTVRKAEIFQDEEETKLEKPRSSSPSDDAEEKLSKEESSENEKPRLRDRSASRAERGTSKPKKELPCRIFVKVSGVEAFLYNRSPVFDSIVEQTRKKAESSNAYAGDEREPPEQSDLDSAASIKENTRRSSDTTTRPPLNREQTLSSIQEAEGSRYQRPRVPAWLRILPVRIDCKRAAAAVGNEHTTSIIVAKVDNAGGVIDAGQAGVLDYYKLLFNFNFSNIKVEMKPNRDFKQYQLETAQRILRETELATEAKPKKSKAAWLGLGGRWTNLFGWLGGWHTKSSKGSLRTASMRSETVLDEKSAWDRDNPNLEQWHGLARYLEDNERNEHAEWDQVEYAKASTLIDCEKIGMRFYWDIPGAVPDSPMGAAGLTDGLLSNGSPSEDMNGSKPPDYGLDLFVHGGVVVYGPWADRQRVNLQRSFFPQPYVDAVAPDPLKPGAWRVCTVFKIFISIEEDIVLRVPCREPSKDHEWRGRGDLNKLSGKQQSDKGTGRSPFKMPKSSKRAKANKQSAATGADVRPYAWIDVTVKRNSTVNYVMDMFARRNGYNNRLDLDVKGTEISTSVNHALLWRAGALTMFADLSNPIYWNKLRKWPFKIVCDDLELFILRDHMFLITDLVNDWSSGPPPEFYTFVPYFYEMDMTFRNFCMYLNVNDANIVNEPADLDRNVFLTLEGRSLNGVLGIPLENYRPKKGGITFDVLAQDMRMRFMPPSVTTYDSLVEDKQIAELPHLTLKGSFESNTESRPGLTDVLRMDLVGTGLKLKAYGFVIRYLINVKQNYFGDYLHFRTLEEFQDAGACMNTPLAPTKTGSTQPSPANELDVILCIQAEDATVMAPTKLYSIDQFIRLNLPHGNIDLRLTSYYMDLAFNFSPVSIFSGATHSTDIPGSPVENETSTQIFIAGVDLLGYRLFGLPPHEPAYVNDWEVDVGAITGECSSGFIQDLAFAARAFVFTFADGENMWPVGDPFIIHDVVFLQLQTNIVHLWMHVDTEAFLLSTQPVRVDFNDLAGDVFSQHVNVLVPDLTFACVDGRSASRHRVRTGRKQPVRTYAFFQTSVSLSVVGRKPRFVDERGLQQAHIREQDQRTRRALFLQRRRPNMRATLELEPDVEPAAMAFPRLPPPLSDLGTELARPSSIKSIPSIGSTKQLSSKSSRSSLSQSVRGGALSVPFASLRRRSSRSSSQRAPFETPLSVSSPLSNDEERAAYGLPPSTMAFSSPWTEPYFPLDTIEPDQSNVPGFMDVSSDDEDDVSESISLGGAIHDPDLDENTEHITIFIKLIPGIRAYAEPKLAFTAAKVLGLLQPEDPEAVLDAYQVQVMMALSARQANTHQKPKVVEVQAMVPSAHIRVANLFLDDTSADQVDLKFKPLDYMLRIRNHAASSEKIDTIAMHITLGMLSVSLSELHNSMLAKPVIEASIDDVLVWVTLATVQALHVSTRGVSAEARSVQAEYFAGFMLRVLELVKDLQPRFERPLEVEKMRLHNLIYAIATHCEDAPDPMYMSKQNYMMRAFPEHYRNQDSWKLVTRCRHALQYLPSGILRELSTNFRSHDVWSPDEQVPKVIGTWATRINFDVPNPVHTLAFEFLFGPDDGRAFTVSEPKPLGMTWRTERLHIAVDENPTAARVDIEEISLAMDKTPPSTPTGLMLVDDNKRTKLLAQVHTSVVDFAFDWSICTIVESFIARKDRFLVLVGAPSKPQKKVQMHFLEDELQRFEFQIAFSTDIGRIALQTINLRHRSQAEGLKLSLIGTSQSEDANFGQAACAILNADAAVTEMYAQSRCVWQTMLTSPSLYLDHVQPLEKTHVPPSVTIATAYTDLQVNIKDQIAGIISAVDAIVMDELTTVQKLVKMSKNADEIVAKEQEMPTKTLPKPKLHVASLAGTLQLDVTLLSNLSYQLVCKSASVRVAPSMSADNKLAIDFDIAEQIHAFLNASNSGKLAQDLLQVPPINGHVGLLFRDDVTHVTVGSSVQQIEVDASAISGIVAVLSRAEVVEVIKSVKDDVHNIKGHIRGLDFGKPAKSRQTSVGPKPVIFDVRGALLGLRISTTTPHATKGAVARLSLGIGPFYCKANNFAEKLPEGGTRTLDVRAQVKAVGADLSVHKGKDSVPCGNISLGISLLFQSLRRQDGNNDRGLTLQIPGIEVNAYPETAPTLVDVLNHMQDSIKDVDLSREVEYLRRLRKRRPSIVLQPSDGADENPAPFSTADLLALSVSLNINNVQVSWLIDQAYAMRPNWPVHEPVLTIALISLEAKGGHQAKLTIQDLMVQLVPKKQSKQMRTLNSALIPEISFSAAYWSKDKEKSLAFKATGRPLDLRLETRFMLPISAVQRSVEWSVDQFMLGTATWKNTPTTSGAPRKNLFGDSKFVAVLVEVDFAGGRVYLQDAGQASSRSSTAADLLLQHGAQHGRYGQFAADGDAMNTTLVAPGVFLKVQFNDNEPRATLYGELMVEASKNMLLPNVVPLVLQISKSVEEVLKNREASTAKRKQPVQEPKPQQRLLQEDAIVNADPEALFGKMKINLGLRICRQEFGLTCQPIARVDAKAELDDFYFTMNTIESDDNLGRFFAMSAVVRNFGTSVKHMYSREPTFSFEMESIVLSLMNSKHISGVNGISAILKLNPTRTSVNAKQLQDLLIFREIWLPPEIRNAAQAAQAQPQTQPTTGEDYLMSKYQSMSAAAAFPWNATISITELSVDLDLGQNIGKSSFSITNLWASSQKSSTWEQNLCIGLDEMAVKSIGRMSGFVSLGRLGVRTTIKWPGDPDTPRKTPLIQAAIGFQRLRAKAAFDYQAFAFVDIEQFDFLMYNVRARGNEAKDRLVAILDGAKIYAFMTSTSPSQALGLVQAFERLIDEKKNSYKQSLRDLEKYARRESIVIQTRHGPQVSNLPSLAQLTSRTPISLHTDVILTLGTVSVGAFPSTFFDNQLLKLEATNIQARFAVGLNKGKIHSGLGMTLGQLQVALASVKKVAVPKTLGDVSIDDVVNSAVNSKGGTILRVPKVIATMQTWQASDPEGPDANTIDYIFRSLFDGKIDVGWNLSRINFIKGMWMAGSRALASRLGGKALPPSAVKISTEPQDKHTAAKDDHSNQQGKITAEVNLPQSRYEYRALEPAIIETPQLRDMGEATPPLEWIGLQRDRLPNVTHQIIIVSLLEVAKEVEDAYTRILGVS